MGHKRDWTHYNKQLVNRGKIHLRRESKESLCQAAAERSATESNDD